ncbi:16S rRNA (guanine(527)-N(7))-methyltransferase RsmG [Aquisalimonas sp.]|uniref:16S rRNA (guanine(527)-N(7))-methyltransferase RsmG n=1 Tax=Aquisalimonas sp. TaxID=1872621 RepID=UPI0025C702EA|nr:16S rRNA (guanine(527)-N(7))-methyltransferase RsmG [Aquisalimonas sp.]
MSGSFPRADVHAALLGGLSDLPAADVPVDALVDYLALLHRWNQVFNLSAVRDPLAMVTRHVLDSLAALSHVAGPRLLDVGSGAGLPGIPLALCRRDLDVTLLDSNGKKTRFLRQVVAELQLSHVVVVQERVERWRGSPAFDTIIARAYSRVDRFVLDAGRLVADGGQLLAMKGRFDAPAETAALPGGWRYRADALAVPGLDAERCLVRIRRAVDVTTGGTHG